MHLQFKIILSTNKIYFHQLQKCLIIALFSFICCQTYDDCPTLTDTDLIQLNTLLPSNDDYIGLIANFCPLIARVLMSYMPFFSNLGDGSERHIKHEFYSKMSSKSEVVSIHVHLDGFQHCTH